MKVYSIHLKVKALVNPHYYSTSLPGAKSPPPLLFPLMLMVENNTQVTPVFQDVSKHRGSLCAGTSLSPSDPGARGHCERPCAHLPPFQAAHLAFCDIDCLFVSPGLGPGSLCFRSWFLTQEETTSFPWTLHAHIQSWSSVSKRSHQWEGWC